MKFETTYRLEDFILNTQWETLPTAVKQRMKGCFLDLMGALLIGSRSQQFEVGLRLAESIYGTGEIPVIGSRKTLTVNKGNGRVAFILQHAR